MAPWFLEFTATGNPRVHPEKANVDLSVAYKKGQQVPFAVLILQKNIVARNKDGLTWNREML